MKKYVIILGLLCFYLAAGMVAKAQVAELEQLALNIEKLAQFKNILSDMKKGYEILTGGYNTVKNISEGNFKLHQVFLDGLMDVSPAVKKYKRVGDIINYQLRIIKEYKAAFGHFKQGGWFRDDEIDYLGKIYGKLVSESLESLDDLLVVITAKKLRMSDEERLSAIDGIYKDMSEKLQFLRKFNDQTEVLSLQRAKEMKDAKTLGRIYGDP
ncbi:TerB family tellurite resistance protein [Niabella beijingensis]|uniref:TerB family tellurite resistance protein n=1 Tax=Niabella beijingensis TaxID=2872700 RepID=UPI001CC10005|nr:TerB family tellurite resistance protein [Niabella beijingensis]MBZ4187616.1 TerB family tellurite resistance protein [Niabella beijingensis]